MPAASGAAADVPPKRDVHIWLTSVVVWRSVSNDKVARAG